MKEAPPEETTELEKDLKVYLHEKESVDKKIEDIFSEKREEGFEE